MLSLRAKKNEGGKKGGGKIKKKILDLDNDDDDEGDDDEGVMEKEKKFLEQLQKSLKTCQLCGPTKCCKIANNGQHVVLTFHQLRAWAVSLVCT